LRSLRSTIILEIYNVVSSIPQLASLVLLFMGKHQHVQSKPLDFGWLIIYVLFQKRCYKLATSVAKPGDDLPILIGHAKMIFIL
jgi:hypothetical protein